MVSFIAAVATDDGERLIDRHFGDAALYSLFAVGPDGITPLGPLTNSVDEENPDIHADPEKAKGISGLLRQAGVKVAVSRIFGPNIKRIRKQFVCVVTDHPTVAESMDVVREHFREIVESWEAGEGRKHLVFRLQTSSLQKK